MKFCFSLKPRVLEPIAQVLEYYYIFQIGQKIDSITIRVLQWKPLNVSNKNVIAWFI
jgi:hypothetical protein